MNQPTNDLRAIVKSESGNLEKAMGIFSAQGFEIYRVYDTPNFLISGPGKNFEAKLGYKPNTNTGVIPTWAKDSVSEITYTETGEEYSN